MGKIMKYCSSCEEGFAERFTFCPDCGGQLQAYEMNPVSEEKPENMPAPEAPAFIASSEAEDILELETPAEDAVGQIEAEPELIAEAPIEQEEPVFEEAEEISAAETETTEYIPEPATIPTTGVFYQTEPMHADEPHNYFSSPEVTHEDDGYYVTVLQEKNVKQRNVLLLGATTLVLTLAIGGWGISLFQKELAIGSIGDEQFLVSLIEQVPMTVEEEKQQEKDKEGGGGGGGGREDKDPVSRGDLANQSPTPTRPPDARTHRMDNPSLVLPPPQTEGRRQFEQKYDRYGDPNSRFEGLSNGPGLGGGQGTGVGTGQGPGRGTGTGSGTGSGSGSGLGDGDGPGRGSGGPGGPPPRTSGPSSPLRITAQPKAPYTEEARKNQVQGKVILRVTFLASGQIGSIATVRGLPNGLTESAIAAARNMRFEPRMDNGQRVSVTRTVEYTFTMY